MSQNLALTFDDLYMRRPGSDAHRAFVYRYIGTRLYPSPVEITDAYTDADSGERVVCLMEQDASVPTILPESLFNEWVQNPNPRNHFFESLTDGLQAWEDFNARCIIRLHDESSSGRR